ncbi:hypothetical protein RJ639_038810 [Escallonia herrerae]|uniref:AAA+ ATPase domain-containing protein n=1 Tax=Escallonia herrerae TaxID=1293975 RepID=A0AA88WPA7_9ASTE|nr:hypothetical protein RJ639_038810 [Escallonia herrerae]
MNFPVIGDILGRVTNCGVDVAVREAGYLFKYRTNVTVLKENLEKLKGVLSRVEDRVEECRRNARNVYEHVSKWLDDAKKMKEDLELFLGEEMQKRAQGVCFNLPFPNLYYRFKLGREAKKKSDAVSELIKNGESLETRIAPLPPLVEETDHKYQIFESREKVLKDIVAALKDDTVARVGIYGMPGVGKTTMMEQVRSQLVGERCYEEVAFAVVSATLDVKSIQKRLGKDLGLTALDKEEDKLERARLLKRRLNNNGKKVLLILDDVWSKLPLADIGIDFGDAESFKILMTSRKERVCVDNNCHRSFKIELLNEDEARCLFKQHAGDCIEKQEIRPLAEKVLKECGELPLVIRAIGEALKGGALFEWKNALEQFKNFSPLNIDNVDEQAYKTLELSFNLLKPKETKVCLLLCSTFQEDAEISMDELTRLAKAMGYLPDMDSFWKARNRVLTSVKGLKSSGLLLEGRYEDTVKMHDVIRDVAVSIAAPKELNYEILVKSGYITEWPLAEETCQRYGAIRLRCNRTLELPRIFECPKLQTFSLINDGNLIGDQIEVPNTFFGGLEKLKALEMRGVSISTALLSLPNPTNLRMLRLRVYKLELDMTTLKGLGKLEVLILGGVTQVPLELGELRNLRVLDLSGCDGLRVIQPGVLSSLSYLEELYLPRPYIASTSILDELLSLTRVTTLEIHLPDLMTFPDYEFCEKLDRYGVLVGDDGIYCGGGSATAIGIHSETYVDLKGGIKVLVERAESVRLTGIRHCLERVFYESNGGGFVDLEELSVRSFSKLEVLEVSSCGFKYLFSVSVARGLNQLQHLEIKKCDAMEAIVGNECNGDEGEIMDPVIFHKLKSVCLVYMESLTSFYSERRKTRENLNSNPAQSLFNEKVAFPALENLCIWKLESLRCIWEDEYHIENSFSQLSSLEVQQCTRLENVVPSTMLKQLAKLRELVLRGLPNLKQSALNSNEFHGNVYAKLEELHILGCSSLRNVFSPFVAKNLNHLKTLQIGDSEETVEIITTAGQGQEETTDDIIFPQLTSLELRNMPKLSSFWNFGCQEQHEEINVELDLCQPQPVFGKKFLWNDGSHGFLGLLEVLVIDGCSILKSMFSCSMARCFQQLRVFVIRLCPAMEEVIYDDEGGKGGTGDQIVFPRLKFLKLETLPKFTGFCSANYDLNMPSLKAVGLVRRWMVTMSTNISELVRNLDRNSGIMESFASATGGFNDVKPCDDINDELMMLV